jgi:UDP-glucose 4-epimerase
MDCLVTGGAGFIGSNLVDALVERGDRVTVIDDLSTGKRENLAWALRNGAVLKPIAVQDAAAVEAVFDAAQPEVVFHLAARADVRFSVAHPTEDAVTNVLGMINVLERARSHRVRRVVYSSTGGGLYGEADVLPTPEDYPVRPLAPYGQSKYAAEGYCHVYARLHGLSTVTLRYGNVYGPRQDVHGEGGVVAIFAGCLVEGRRPTVFGDGRQTRDWVEVDDVVRANLLAAACADSDPLNIGRGEETSVLDLLSALNEVSASRSLPEPEFAPERPGEVRRSRLDVSRAKRELGWEARVQLGDGLRAILAGLDEG